MARRLFREVKDLLLGPVDGDPFEQFVPRLCSALLALIAAAPYAARWVL